VLALVPQQVRLAQLAREAGVRVDRLLELRARDRGAAAEALARRAQAAGEETRMRATRMRPMKLP
jgi:hypothetical protein